MSENANIETIACPGDCGNQAVEVRKTGQYNTQRLLKGHLRPDGGLCEWSEAPPPRRLF